VPRVRSTSNPRLSFFGKFLLSVGLGITVSLELSFPFGESGNFEGPAVGPPSLFYFSLPR